MKNNCWMRSLFVGIILVMLLLFSACSVSQKDSNQMGEYNPNMNGTADETTANTEPALGASVPEGRNIIRNAAVELEAQDAKASYQQLLDWVTQKNGYETEQSLHLNQNRNTIMATLHIPAEHLDEFLQMAGNTGSLLRQSTYSDDITAHYTDTELRAKSTRASLDAYYRLLEKAKTVEEIVSVQRAIDDLTLQIESHQALLKQWDEQLEFSRVSLSISEPDPYEWLLTYRWVFVILGGVVLIVVLFLLSNRNKKRYDQMMQARQGMPWYQSGVPPYQGAPPQPDAPTEQNEQHPQ